MDKNSLYLKIDDFKQELAMCLDGEEWNNNRAYYYYQIGLAYSEMENYKKAIVNLKLAIKYYKDYGNAYYELGVIYSKQNNPEKAILNLKEALRVHPEKSEVKERLEKLEKMYNAANIKYDYEIDLETCSKEDILTLSGFDESKAENFISQREEGKMWYKIEEFVKDFNLTPYNQIKIVNRLKFPLKPLINHKRTFDI